MLNYMPLFASFLLKNASTYFNLTNKISIKASNQSIKPIIKTYHSLQTICSTLLVPSLLIAYLLIIIFPWLSPAAILVSDNPAKT
jgi:hypothetical protein